MSVPRRNGTKVDHHSYVVVRKRKRNSTSEYIVAQIPQLADTQSHVAIFCGPKAKQFANQYADYKNSQAV